jgi:signal transduction histidine kinase
LSTSDQDLLKNLLPSGFSEGDILQMFIDQSNDILLLTSPKLVIEYISSSAEKLLEISVGDVIGNKINEVMGNFPSLPLMKSGQKMVIPIISPITKRKFLIEFQFKPLYRAPEVIQAIFAIGRDVTDREMSLKKFKDAAYQEKELNQLKSRFVSMASHEFRTPLATIQSSAFLIEMLLKREFGPEIKDKIINHVYKIINQTNRLTDITSDVLLLEKSIHQEMKIQAKNIQISKFIKELIDGINQENFDRRTVWYYGPKADKTITIDPSLLIHILRNLIFNALKYSEKGQDPEVHLSFQGPYFEVRIKDYGIGIPKEDQEQIFTSFHRAKNVGNIKGTGLGLNIVKELTKKLNGTIWFNSKLGKGSEFFVSFPC